MSTLPDLRPQLFSAYDQALAIAALVEPSQLESPTPCEAMNVAGLIDHTVFAARRAAALGRGELPAVESSGPHVELAEVPAALREAGAEAKAAWADDATLERTITMPWGEDYPGRALVGIYLVELATHCWDIAFATGHTSALDDDLGADTLTCAEASIRPDYRNAEGNPFGPEVPAPADATVWERLAAFMGRRPPG